MDFANRTCRSPHVQRPDEVIDQVDASRIGCLVLDFRLPKMNGLELYQTLVDGGCKLPFIIVTGDGDVPDAVAAIRQGAIDFLLKPLQMDLFIETVRSAIQSDIKRTQSEHEHHDAKSRIDSLTPREREVLDLVAVGRLSKHIASDLNISMKTVEAHRANIMRKLERRFDRRTRSNGRPNVHQQMSLRMVDSFFRCCVVVCMFSLAPFGSTSKLNAADSVDALLLRSFDEVTRHQQSQADVVADFDIEAPLLFASKAWTSVLVGAGQDNVAIAIGPDRLDELVALNPGAIIRFQGKTGSTQSQLRATSIEVIDADAALPIKTARDISDPKLRHIGGLFQVTGLVREVLARDGQTICSTRMMGVPVQIKIHSPLTIEDARRLADQTIRVRAALQVQTRELDSTSSFELLVMKKGQVEIAVSNRGEESFESLDQLARSGFASSINQWRSRSGQVAFTDRHNTLVIFNQREAFLVRSELASFFEPGHHVTVDGPEVVGENGVVEMRPKIIVHHKDDAMPPPVATTITALQRENIPTRVLVEGEILSSVMDRFACHLILQSDQQAFRADVPIVDPAAIERIERFSPGTFIEITGTPIRLPFSRPGSDSAAVRRSADPVSMTLFAATVDDVVIQSSPYLMQPNQVFWTAGVLVTILAGGLIWNRSLTRKVASRTARLNAITSHLETAFEAIQEGVVLVDENGTVVRKNQRFADLFDNAPDTGEPTAAFFRQVATNFSSAEFAEFVSSDADYGHRSVFKEYRCKRTHRTIQVYSHPINARDGRLWAFTDVTEQRRLEEQLFQAQKMELIGQFSGGIAHDFNNLLTVIRTSLSMIDRTATKATVDVRVDATDKPSPVAEFTSAAHTAVDRAAELTGQLLDFSRRSRLDISVVDINQVVRGVYQLIRRTLPLSIEIAVRATPSPAQARVDLAKIEQVLINLCQNARDAIGDAPGHVLIETRLVTDNAIGDSIIITVRDDGQGIPDNVRKRIFEPFFTTKSSGTGLGLSMALGVIENLGGRIECESETKRGTSFHVWLPVAASLGHRPADDPAKLRLLVVDDTPRDRQTTETLFAELGHEVVSTSSGESAIEYLSGTETFDVVILDDLVGNVPAMEIFDRIRDRWPDQTVAMCGKPAAVSTDASQGKHPRLQPIALSKPFRVAELRSIFDSLATSAGR